MTTSGLAALLVCKGQLDGTPGWDARREAVNQAIRDGCGAVFYSLLNAMRFRESMPAQLVAWVEAEAAGGSSGVFCHLEPAMCTDPQSQAKAAAFLDAGQRVRKGEG